MKIKKILSAIAIFILLLSCGMSADATDIVASGECGLQGNNLIWELDSDGLLAISGRGEMKDWSSNSAFPWQPYQEDIKTILLSDGVTSIGMWSFWYCTNLTSITIPNSIESINSYAFAGCENLTHIYIPDSVSYIGERVFDYCKSLVNIDVDSDNAHYDSIDGVLFDKNITTLIQYPAKKTDESYAIPDGVETIDSNAFYFSRNLTSITIPSSVSSISSDRTFENCAKLISIDVACDNEYYTSVDGVLFDKNITTLIRYPGKKADELYIIPDSVINIDNRAFYSCSKLANIIISAGVENIGKYSFCGCGNLISIIFFDDIKSISDNAFLYCKKLETVYYTADKEKWDDISIGDYNENLINANIVFNYVVKRESSVKNELLHTFIGEDGSEASAVLSTVTLGIDCVTSIEWEYKKTKAKCATILTGVGSEYIFGLIIPYVVNDVENILTKFEY